VPWIFTRKVEMTIVNLFVKGGPLMFVLLALSILGLSIIISKYRQILVAKSIQKKLADSLSTTKSAADIEKTVSNVQEETPLYLVVKKALSLVNEDYSIAKDSIESTANVAIHKLEKGLGWVSTIAAVAPLVGFLGTVTGMVKVFINIAAHSQQGIDISLLANGIWEALLTTVGGLVVGIPAIIFYNDLVSHIENNAKLLMEQVDELMLKLYNKK
jgi:biopolymer transport protein ExbB